MTTTFCPVHLFSREECSPLCAWQRQELKRLGSDYRQLWFDRRHGVKPMPAFQYQLRYGAFSARRG